MSKCACSRDNCRHLCYGEDKLTKICAIDGEVVTDRADTCAAFYDREIITGEVMEGIII